MFAHIPEERSRAASWRGLMPFTTFLATEDGANLLVAYRRAAEYRRDRGAARWRANLMVQIDPAHFAQPEETALYQQLDGMSTTLEAFRREEHFDRRDGAVWRGSGARLTISSTRSPSIPMTPRSGKTGCDCCRASGRP